MVQKGLSVPEVLAGYDAVSALYPHVPGLSLWRAWEYAAYQRYQRPEPVLDIGCGDGQYFRLVWPNIQNVSGVDFNHEVVELARKFGIYREVYEAPAQHLPVPPRSFASAFANCSLEHMDDVSQVLRGIHDAVKPGAPFLLSVVTEKFVEWRTLPRVAEWIGAVDRAGDIQAGYERYHHLVNPFPVEVWVDKLGGAGFEVLEHIPILPEMVSRIFLLIDTLWHIPKPGGGEFGELMYPYFQSLPNFPDGLRLVLEGALRM